MSIDQVSINGNAPGWGSCVLKVMNGERIFGFTGITFSDKLTEVLGYASGRHHAPTHRSPGKYEVDPCKITGYVESVQLFRDAQAALSETGNSYGAGAPEFEAILETFEPRSGRPPLIVNLRRCKWIENAYTGEENPDPRKEDFAFQPMRIERNGKVLYDDSEGNP